MADRKRSTRIAVAGAALGTGIALVGVGAAVAQAGHDPAENGNHTGWSKLHENPNNGKHLGWDQHGQHGGAPAIEDAESATKAEKRAAKLVEKAEKADAKAAKKAEKAAAKAARPIRLSPPTARLARTTARLARTTAGPARRAGVQRRARPATTTARPAATTARPSRGADPKTHAAYWRDHDERVGAVQPPPQRVGSFRLTAPRVQGKMF